MICPICEHFIDNDDYWYGDKCLSCALANLTAPEPEPACKHNQDWMLQHLKDIASELENDRDLKLWDAVQDLDES